MLDIQKRVHYTGEVTENYLLFFFLHRNSRLQSQTSRISVCFVFWKSVAAIQTVSTLECAVIVESAKSIRFPLPPQNEYFHVFRPELKSVEDFVVEKAELT